MRPLFPAAGEWTGRWIEPVDAPDGPELQRPAHHLVGEFNVAGTVVEAFLHVTAHGIYEAFLNGARIGDGELTPGFTAYRQRLQVQTFDVTALVREGGNALGALVSDGWWRGQHGIQRRTDSYGPATGLLAEIHVRLAGGDTIVVGTDGSWRSTPSHIRRADLVAGEVHDLRRRIPNWASLGTDRSYWDPVVVADHRTDILCATIGSPVRRVEELRAVSVTELAPGRHVVDFGQNSNGWTRLTDLGPAGTTLTITYGEWLDASGDVTQNNVKESPFARRRAEPVSFQTDVVTSAGDGTVFEPRHSTKGFQYVRVDGHLGPLDPSTITSIVVHTDLERLGGFACSDERINRLHLAADWSLRANACEIPTDCPTRERSGWTGDWQIYVATAAELYNVTDFSVKWLADVAAEQRPDGAVLQIVPDPIDYDTERSAWSTIQGVAGWGDGVVHVPYELYRATGRADVFDALFVPMQRWVDFAATRAASGRHPSRIEARPEPMMHEQYLWDSGFHFGEWLEPDISMLDLVKRIQVDDHGPVATAFLYRSAKELAEIATILGDLAIADHYADLAAHVLDAWRTEFIDADGHVHPATQANLVRALSFGLVPDALRMMAADDLVALIRAADTHLGTGFLATPFLLPVLADAGHLDVAYELLFQTSEPSWLAMIDAGATTIWEEWAALRPDGTIASSLNHYSKGAVISFLHRYTAGVQIVEPGYRRFRVAPLPGGGLTSARFHHDSPHGRIEASWKIGLDHLGAVDVTVPIGTTAELVLPDGSTFELAPGDHRQTWTAMAR